MHMLLGASLFISGGGHMTEELRQCFLELAGPRLVIITTASPRADTNEMETEFRGTVLHTRSRVTANDFDFVKPLKTATGVWFEGGDQNLLTDAYLGTSTVGEIWGVLARGGCVGGSSAGAAIMSPIMLPRLDRGFGFLQNTVVDQHFTERNREQRLLNAIAGTSLTGIGIDEGTALVIKKNGETKVLGQGRVHVYKSFKKGDAFKW